MAHEPGPSRQEGFVLKGRHREEAIFFASEDSRRGADTVLMMIYGGGKSDIAPIDGLALLGDRVKRQFGSAGNQNSNRARVAFLSIARTGDREDVAPDVVPRERNLVSQVDAESVAPPLVA